MKIANLVLAIIYTLVYVCLLLVGFMDGDTEMVVGVIVLSAPIILLWMNYNYLQTRE